jgi:hypothetical protein
VLLLDGLFALLSFCSGIAIAVKVNQPIYISGFNVYIPSIVSASKFAGVINGGIVRLQLTWPFLFTFIFYQALCFFVSFTLVAQVVVAFRYKLGPSVEAPAGSTEYTNI